MNALRGYIRHAEQKGISRRDCFASMPNLSLLAEFDTTGTIPRFEWLSRTMELLDTSSDARKALVLEMQEYEQLTSITLPYRRLFKTAEGHVGLGPQSMLEGDLV